MRRLTLISLSVLLLATIARAQTPEQSWDYLKTLREGEKIQVVDQKLKSQNGTFVSFSDEAISFRVGQDEVTIQRADVLQVSSRKGMSRGQHALIGLAIGAGAGAALAGKAQCYGPCPAVMAASALTGAGIGAGVGAALPPGHPTIYRAERRQDQTAP